MGKRVPHPMMFRTPWACSYSNWFNGLSQIFTQLKVIFMLTLLMKWCLLCNRFWPFPGLKFSVTPFSLPSWTRYVESTWCWWYTEEAWALQMEERGKIKLRITRKLKVILFLTCQNKWTQWIKQCHYFLFLFLAL